MGGSFGEGTLNSHDYKSYKVHDASVSGFPEILGDLMKNPLKRGLPLIAKCWFHGDSTHFAKKKTSKWVHLPQIIRVKQHIFIRVETTYHVDRGYTEVATTIPYKISRVSFKYIVNSLVMLVDV